MHRFKALSIIESILAIKFDYVIWDLVVFYAENKTLGMSMLVAYVFVGYNETAS